MRDSAPSTDEITKTLIVVGGDDTIDKLVSLIQALWKTEYKKMGNCGCRQFFACCSTARDFESFHKTKDSAYAHRLWVECGG